MEVPVSPNHAVIEYVQDSHTFGFSEDARYKTIKSLEAVQSPLNLALGADALQWVKGFGQWNAPRICGHFNKPEHHSERPSSVAAIAGTERTIAVVAIPMPAPA